MFNLTEVSELSGEQARVPSVIDPLGSRKAVTMNALFSAFGAFDIPEAPEGGWRDGLTSEESDTLLIALARVREVLTCRIGNYEEKLIRAWEKDNNFPNWYESPYKPIADRLEDIFRSLNIVHKMIAAHVTKGTAKWAIDDLRETVKSRFSAAEAALLDVIDKTLQN